jgi:hypothetical protein
MDEAYGAVEDARVLSPVSWSYQPSGVVRESGEKPELTRSGMGDEQALPTGSLTREGACEIEPEPEDLPA